MTSEVVSMTSCLPLSPLGPRKLYSAYEQRHWIVGNLFYIISREGAFFCWQTKQRTQKWFLLPCTVDSNNEKSCQVYISLEYVWVHCLHTTAAAAGRYCWVNNWLFSRDSSSQIAAVEIPSLLADHSCGKGLSFFKKATSSRFTFLCSHRNNPGSINAIIMQFSRSVRLFPGAL